MIAATRLDPNARPNIEQDELTHEQRASKIQWVAMVDSYFGVLTAERAPVAQAGEDREA